MRKLIPGLVALALLAAACGSTTEDPVTEASAAATSAPAADNDQAAPEQSEESAAPAQSDDAAEAPAAVPVQAVSCGYNEDLDSDRVEVAQIPGDGRGSGPSALTDVTNPDFPAPLVDLNRIFSGGPAPDGIPPIDDPRFQTASTVDWLRCNEPVLSLSVNGEARAYPVQIMTWHELVNDTFGDVPVTVSFCPLCNSALAYNRQLGDRTVTFGTSGRLFNSSLVMYDRETESLWTHFNGAAVVGQLTGTQLELLPIQTTSWASFVQANPDGLVLTRDTGHNRSYGVNPYAGYDDVNTSPFLFDGESDPRLAAKERVVGIRRGGDNAAVVLEGLSAAGVLEVEVAGELLSVWHLPGTSSALETERIENGRDIGAVGVFLPVVDGQALTFSRVDGGFTDAETGSMWNIQGTATDGELVGSQLQQVEHLDTFWFALAAFEPDTRVVQA